MRFWLVVTALALWGVGGLMAAVDPALRIANLAICAAVVIRMLLRRYGLRPRDLIGGARRDR